MEFNWSGFYKKSIDERLELLNKYEFLNDEFFKILATDTTLSSETANNMVENVLGTFSIPFSITPNLVVNGKEFCVPMVTEEPSVVAACSNAAKIIAKSGGFISEIVDRKMIGHVALYGIDDIIESEKEILNQKNNILKIANDAHPSIVSRGGGAKDLFTKIITEDDVQFLVVYLVVDVLEAMGANIINTMLEGIKPVLETISNGLALMAILSNHATSSLVKATCDIKIETLTEDINKAINLAKKIELASKFAKADVYRAATHNKGIFNGIDSVVIATGNDWRAIEAACHSYAARNGRYEGLSTWTFSEEKNILHGELTIPMPIATVGGSIGINPTVKASHHILGYPDAKTLSGIIVSVGLAQNFAALRALVSDGIQKGHMKLHAKSLAILAGAKDNEIDLVVEMLKNEKHMNLETVRKVIERVRGE